MTPIGSKRKSSIAAISPVGSSQPLKRTKMNLIGSNGSNSIGGIDSPTVGYVKSVAQAKRNNKLFSSTRTGIAAAFSGGAATTTATGTGTATAAQPKPHTVGYFRSVAQAAVRNLVLTGTAKNTQNKDNKTNNLRSTLASASKSIAATAAAAKKKTKKTFPGGDSNNKNNNNKNKGKNDKKEAPSAAAAVVPDAGSDDDDKTTMAADMNNNNKMTTKTTTVAALADSAASSNANAATTARRGGRRVRRGGNDGADSTTVDPDERTRQIRDRNREHARLTRLRKKVYVAKLQEALEKMVEEKEAEEARRKHEAAVDAGTREVRLLVLEEFLRMRGRNFPHRSRWNAILDADDFTLTMPVTRFRGMVHKRGGDDGDGDGIPRFHQKQVLRGVDEVMRDSALSSSFLQGLLGTTTTEQHGRDTRIAELAYHCDKDTLFMDGTTILVDWTAIACYRHDQPSSSTSEEQHGSNNNTPLVVEGTAKATFDPASNKLRSVVLSFDTGAITAQIDRNPETTKTTAKTNTTTTTTTKPAAVFAAAANNKTDGNDDEDDDDEMDLDHPPIPDNDNNLQDQEPTTATTTGPGVPEQIHVPAGSHDDDDAAMAVFSASDADALLDTLEQPPQLSESAGDTAVDAANDGDGDDNNDVAADDDVRLDPLPITLCDIDFLDIDVDDAPGATSTTATTGNSTTTGGVAVSVCGSKSSSSSLTGGHDEKTVLSSSDDDDQQDDRDEPATTAPATTMTTAAAVTA